MQLTWQWPWAALAGIIVSIAIVAVMVACSSRRKDDDDRARTFSLDDDLNTESASRLFRQWRVLSPLAAAMLAKPPAMSMAAILNPSPMVEQAP